MTAILSLAGILGGAVLGSRIAPYLLSGGSRSPYTPLFALGGAAFFAIVLEALGSYAGSRLRSSLRLKPLRAVDSAGGLLLGGATALAIVWVLGTVALRDRPAPERARAAVQAPPRAGADRPDPGDRRAACGRGAPESLRAPEAGRPRGGAERRSHPRHRLRARDRGERLGRGMGGRRDRRPRRRRRALDDRRSAGRTPDGRRGDRIRLEERRCRSARARARISPASPRRAAAWHRGRDPRLSGERAPDGGGRADRRNRSGSERGRLRPRPGLTRHHEPARAP